MVRRYRRGELLSPTSLFVAGVNGVLQSMLLSIGGIRFRNHHLEMYLDPKDLHRDMIFRSINFGNESHLNISITVDHDNRAVISVSIDNELRQAYACDAGCLDPPTKLGFVYCGFSNEKQIFRDVCPTSLVTRRKDQALPSRLLFVLLLLPESSPCDSRWKRPVHRRQFSTFLKILNTCLNWKTSYTSKKWK